MNERATISKDEILNSLRIFRTRRDALLHEDEAAFDHHLERFIEFCRNDPLARRVLRPIEEGAEVNVNAWWEAASDRRTGKVEFPEDPDRELLLRYRLLESVLEKPNRLYDFGFARGKNKKDERTNLFLTLIVRPFADELTHRIGQAADIATPDARTVQAVPLNRIPGTREAKIFLSHKTVDKPLVYRYYNALKVTGFDPWLDEPAMPAGSNLEREIFRGFEESCAAVFFITENFRDEKYLATEVDYAIQQKRKKDKKFAIITLRYLDAAAVPGLLTPYTYKDVENDLQGFYELIRALPVEPGPVRWKPEIVG